MYGGTVFFVSYRIQYRSNVFGLQEMKGADSTLCYLGYPSFVARNACGVSLVYGLSGVGSAAQRIRKGVV